MNKYNIIMGLLCFIMLSVSVTAFPIIEETSKTFFSDMFVVTGGDTGEPTTVEYGTQINDAFLTVKITQENNGFCQKSTSGEYLYTNKLETYFEKRDTSSKVQLQNFYFTTSRDIGDYVSYNLGNLDTHIMDDAWVGKIIGIGATHYVCQIDSNVQSPSIGEWVLDDDYYGSYRGTTDTFTLIDSSSENNCVRKELKDVCEDNRIVTIWQASWTNSDGTCGEEKVYGAFCPSTCLNGECVSLNDVGDSKCMNNNKAVYTWNGNDWDISICMQDGTGYCNDGVCELPTNTNNDTTSSSSGTGQNDDVCTVCEEGMIWMGECQDGSDSIIAKCINCEIVDIPPECLRDNDADIVEVVEDDIIGDDTPNDPNDLSWWDKFINWIKSLFMF